MAKDLEETKASIEGEEPTLEAETPEKETQKEPKPTVRTYTQEELDKAVGKGVSSLQTALSQFKAESTKGKSQLDKLNSEIEDSRAELQSWQDRYEKLLTDHDPEALTGYKNTIALEKTKRELTRREKEQAKKEEDFYVAKMQDLASKLEAQYEVPRDVLETCVYPEQMETVAKAFPERSAKKEETAEPVVEKKPTFDSAVSSGGGLPTHPTTEQLDKLTSEQYAAWWKKRQEESK